MIANDNVFSQMALKRVVHLLVFVFGGEIVFEGELQFVFQLWLDVRKYYRYKFGFKVHTL